VIGGGGYLSLRSFQKLLIALVHQLGNFAADQVSWIGEDLYTIILIFLDLGRTTLLLQEHAVLRSWGFDQVEPMIAQPGYRVLITAFFYFCGHFPCFSLLPGLDAASR